MLGRPVGIAALVAAVFAGCRSQPKQPGDAATPPAHVATFVATDYRFDGPSRIPAGATLFQLDNRGKEPHHLAIARLEQGRTYDTLLAALKRTGPPPAWVRVVGGPNAIGPGGQSNATLELAPGSYAIACFIPSNDGVPHIAKGMIRELTVTPEEGKSAPMGPADVVIKLNEYSFDLSEPLVAGKQIIRVENEGKQDHELVLARLAPGKTMADVEAWEKGGEKGPLPLTLLGGMAPLGPEQHGQFSQTLEPGGYVLLCFVPDSKDGKAHVVHGMMKPVTVP
jgi:hypothetical protein